MESLTYLHRDLNDYIEVIITTSIYDSTCRKDGDP